MDSVDRDRKKAWKHDERLRARAAFPLPDAELAELFEMLETELEEYGCDHTRRLTETWALSHSHSPNALSAWLDQNGGFCDCEVLCNVGPHWKENRLRPADA
jgi:hypothetical protein